MLLTGLLADALFDELKLILYRRKEGCRTQALASPTEQACGVGCSNLCNLFAGCMMNFCNFISNMDDKCRFITLGAMRDWRQEGRIGFDQEALER